MEYFNPGQNREDDGDTASSAGSVVSARSAGGRRGRVFKDLAAWVAARHPVLAQCDAEGLAGQAARLGIRYHISVDKTHNPHMFSALCREEAMRRVLLRATRGRRTLEVLDLFGSARSRLYMPQHNPPMGYVEVNGRMVASTRALSIEWFAAPDTRVQGDTARGEFVREPYPTHAVDLVIAIDIYQSGDSCDTPFTPEFALQVMGRSKSDAMYWIGRFFVGQAGGDDPIDLTGSNGTFQWVEQVFYKDQDGMVVSRSDHHAPAYAPHPWPEWLSNNRSFKGVDIAQVDVVGPYKIMKLTRARAGAIQIRPSTPLQGEMLALDIECEELIWWGLASRRVVRTFNVHRPTYEKLFPTYIAKIPTGALIDGARMVVSKEMMAVPWLQHLASFNSLVYQQYVLDTVYAVIYARRQNDTSAWSRLRRAHVVQEAHLLMVRAIRNPFPANGASITYFCLGVVAGGVMATGAFLRGRYRGAWLCPRYPMVSAVLEECVAYVSEPLAVCCYVTEWALREKSRTSAAVLISHVAGSTSRVMLGWPGRLLALGGHLFTNRAHVKLTGKKKFVDFAELFREGAIKEVVEGAVVHLPGRTTLPSYTSRIVSGPEKFRGVIEIRLDGMDRSVHEALELLDFSPGLNVTYPILITNRLLQQPANNERNLLAAVLLRIHNDPFSEKSGTLAERHEKWRLLGIWFRDHFQMSVTDDFCSVQMNAQLMGKKGQRLLTAHQLDIDGVVQFTGKTINLKWNETISSLKDCNGVVTMKPRAIQNLPPLVHAKMGGYARVFSKELHNKFDGQVWDVAGVPVAIFFAAGYTQLQLSAIAETAMSGVTVFAMSGDDSFVAWGGVCPEFAGEADQSKFDHTQDDGPMKFFMGTVLKAFGFPQEFIDTAYLCCASGYTAKRGRIQIKGTAGTQMPTGITTTTSFNSLSTLAMFVWFLLHRKRLEGLVEAGMELGFEVKYFPRASLSLSTFLKGWWQLGPEGYVWMPLPSAVLKLGKMLSDPVVITGRTVRGEKRRFSGEEAARICAFALAESYGLIPNDYPIFGAFLACLRRLGTRPRNIINGLEESWKPKLMEATVHRKEVLAAIYDRYGITCEEVDDVEELFGQVNSLPAYVEHPVFDKLCDVDYA